MHDAQPRPDSIGPGPTPPPASGKTRLRSTRLHCNRFRGRAQIESLGRELKLLQLRADQPLFQLLGIHPAVSAPVDASAPLPLHLEEDG